MVFSYFTGVMSGNSCIAEKVNMMYKMTNFEAIRDLHLNNCNKLCG